ncbi:hypothetical protein B0H17DRAFT_637569 [Mycena rosella]|uniref:Expansin-like EG45 domain-containing protein n=1 Tax=Mycena rosella TaxID=1033263 RepID=A0AAD7GHM1_MYCRO|nr:hypothetical protein B0H17DRAFT_637569 [Mycena rosella]
MFASSSIALLLSATAVMAGAHQGRSHNSIAMRVNNNTETLNKRDSFVSKEMTWYPTDTGPDACTGKNHQDSDYFVAMGYDQFGDGSGCCGRQLRINYNGKSAVATCVDEVWPCPFFTTLPDSPLICVVRELPDLRPDRPDERPVRVLH